MMNLEWLKTITSLLSQGIEIYESEFSAGKWLDFATNAAQQLGNFSSNPFSLFSNQENSAHTDERDSERQSHRTSSYSENNGSGINFMNLWRLLAPANQLIQQFSAVGPILQAFMKPKEEKPAAPRLTTNPNPGGGFFTKKTVLILLVFALLPVLRINFVPRLR